jgi:hypothetical protein
LERLVLRNGKAKSRREAWDYVKRNYAEFVTVNLWIHTHEPALLRAMRDRVARAIEAALLETPAVAASAR